MRALIAFSLALGLASSAMGDAPATAMGDFPPDVNAEGFGLPGYLPADAIDSAALLGPPPEPDSPRGRADRAYFEGSRSLQGSPAWTRAIRDNDLGEGTFERFSCAAGFRILPRTAPTTFRIMARLDRDIRNATAGAKARYRRERPLRGNAAPICLPREPWMETSFSYPSSHSAQGWTYALILAEIAPERSAALFRNGVEFGDSRAICGVHFQSDVEAGRVVGAALVARLHSDPAFLRDLAAARREVGRARRAGPPMGCPA